MEATFSNNWKYNININNCTDLSPVTENDFCGIQPCPGENTINDKILSKFLDALVVATGDIFMSLGSLSWEIDSVTIIFDPFILQATKEKGGPRV